MLKVGVVGAGTMGSAHSRAYAAMPDVQLVAIADIRAEAAKSLADECGARAVADLTGILAENVDAVDICVPTPLHRTYVERCAKAGKHVVCEKPLARTLDDARAMIDACTAAGVKLFVGQVVRFFPEYRKARELVQGGKLGAVGTARFMRGGGFPHATDDWYASFEQSGGVILDLMIHDFDFLRWCFGPVRRVYALTTAGREFNRLDHALVSLRFESGVIAHVEGTWAHPAGFATRFEIAGESGIIQHDSEQAAPVHTKLRGSGAGAGGVAVPESPLEHSPYELELRHFADCLLYGADPVVTPEDGYEALKISHFALESARTGRAVTL